MVSGFTEHRLPELSSLRPAPAIPALHARARRGLLAVSPRLYVPVTRKVIPEIRKKEGEANTGAASSGFFAFQKLYHLLQPIAGAALGLLGAVFSSVCLAGNLSETIPPSGFGVGFWVPVAVAVLLVSLWKIPSRRWRGLRPPRGFSHRLLVRLLTLGVFKTYCGMVRLFYDIGAPVWLVNSLRLFVPTSLLRAGARVYQERKSQAVAGADK